MRIKPIEHISPSRFYKLQQCALAEVWFISKNAPLIPYHANALLGTVIHKLLEKYSTDGELTIQEFNKVWQECEDVAFQRIHRDEQWRYLPLSEKATFYFPKKFNAQKAVEKILFKEDGEPTHQALSEHPLSSKDGIIKGIADLVIKKNETNVVSVIDFKTGEVHNNEGALKEEYINQLKLYAVLYNHNKKEIFDGVKEWPDSLYIVSSDGNYHTVPYTTDEAEQCFEMVKKSVSRINIIIEEGKDVQGKLSNTGDHCKYCSYRVVCGKYVDSELIHKYDFIGTVSSFLVTPDRKKAVIRFENTPWVLHYYLAPNSFINFSAGQKIIAVNLRKDRLNNPIAYTTSFSVVKTLSE
jgi:CRISPR/Cas system-associated exonuclease Cas4 (RecB family)